MSLKSMLHSFVGGEWSPSLYGRVDLAKYITAVRTMLNFFPHPHGGASNRSGLQFIASTKNSAKKCRLIPFQFSTTQTYVLEFGDSYMRVIKDGGLVVKTSATAWGTGNTYVAGDWVSETGTIYYCLIGHTAGTFATDLAAGKWVAQTIYEIPTPYAEADLPLIKYEQSADTIYLWHPSYAERKLTRTGHTSWTLSSVTFAPSISAPTNLARSSGSASGYNYKVTSVKENGEESLPTSGVAGGRGDTFTWTVASGADHYNIYEDHNGIYYYIGEAGDGSFQVPSSPEVDYETTPPKATNPFNGAGNYAGCGAFFEQRLVRGRTNNKPQTLFGSVIGSFENMNVSSPVQADDAFEFTLNAKKVNEIRWIVAMNDLMVGTSDSEWKISAGTNETTITPTAVATKVQSRYGSSHVQPQVIGNTILFIESSGRVVRDFIYSLEVDSFDGKDLTIMAQHIFEGKEIVDWAYQQHPDSIIWCVLDDGTLAGLTYMREHEIWGWHRHETDGEIESVACISTDYGTDEVYFVVKRTINGSQVRYIERLSQRLYSEALHKTTNDVQDAFFVDCGLTLDTPKAITGATSADPVVITAIAHGFSDGDEVDISDVVGMTELNGRRFTVANKTTDTFELEGIDGSEYADYISSGYVRKAVSTVSGLSHLEGEEVSVLANGSVITGLTVSSGAITLPNKASRVHVGLPYTCDLETMEIEYQTKAGTVQGDFRDTESVVLRLKDTREIWIGGDADHLLEVPFRSDEYYGQPTELFTGDKPDVLIDNGGSGTNRVFIRVQNPLPATILAIVARVFNGE